jgi:hypothetical protein
LAEHSHTNDSPAEALPNQCDGWCCIDRLSWQPSPDIYQRHPFGPGKVNGHWHNFEDARWAPEFAEFLDEMNRMGQGKADLILNGDAFELWQSLDPNDCTAAANKNLG